MEKKRQHWVPRFYLNAFAIPETRANGDPQIFALDMSESSSLNVLRVGTKNIAAEKFLYSPVDESGARDHQFEDKLSDLESLLGTLWQWLGEGQAVPLVDGYRKALAMFVANLWLRHPRQRKVTARSIDRLIEGIQQHIAANEQPYQVIEVTDGSETANTTLEEFEQLRPKSKNDYHKIFVSNINDQTTEIATVLLGKRWNVFVSDTNRFITSDNPVCLTGPADRPFGFDTPGVSVTVPLTPDKLLVIDDREGPSNCYSPIPDRKGFGPYREAPFNFQVVANAYRFIFAPRDDLYQVLEQNLWFCDNITRSDPNSPYYVLRSPEDGRTYKIGRNEPCWCGSGKKYKHCHQHLEKMLADDAPALRNVKRERRDLEL